MPAKSKWMYSKAREPIRKRLKEDLDTWKENHEYGYRWTAESIFSAFWRIFGESVKAVSWKNR